MPVTRIRNTKIPADENLPYGGYYLQRTLPDGRVLAYGIHRAHAMNDWDWAQELKRAREILGIRVDEILEALKQNP